MESYNIGSKLKILNILVNKDLDQKLKQFSPQLSGTQTVTLLYLFEHHNQTVLQTDLAQILYVSHPTVRGIIKRLVKLNLVSVSKLPADKRQIQIKLSDKGKTFMKSFGPQIQKIFEQENRIICKNLSNTEIKHFNDSLNISINNLK